MVIDRRIGAFLIDLAIITALTFMAFGAVADFDMTEFDDVEAAEEFCETRDGDGVCIPGPEGALVVRVSRVASPLLFHTCLWLLRGVMEGVVGWTPGKRATGIRVVDAGGETIGVARGLVRAVFVLVDGFPWGAPMLVGVLIASNSGRQQRLGGLATDSYVVHHAAVGSFITQPVAIATPLPERPPPEMPAPGGDSNRPPVTTPGPPESTTIPAGPPVADGPGGFPPTAASPPVTSTGPLQPGPVAMPAEPPTAAVTPPAPSPAIPARAQGMSFDETRQAWVWVEGPRVLLWDDDTGIWRESPH